MLGQHQLQVFLPGHALVDDRVVLAVHLAQLGDRAQHARDGVRVAGNRVIQPGIQQCFRGVVAELPGNHRADIQQRVAHRFRLRFERLLLFAQFVGGADLSRGLLRIRHLPVFLGQALHRAAGLLQHRVVALAGLGGVVGVVGEQDVGACRDDQQRPEGRHGHSGCCAEGDHGGAGGLNRTGHGQHGGLHLHGGDGIGRHRCACDADRLQQLRPQIDGGQHFQIIDDNPDDADNLAECAHQQRGAVARKRPHGIAVHAAEQVGDAAERLADCIIEAAASGDAFQKLTPDVSGARQRGTQVLAHALGGRHCIAERGDNPVAQLRRTHARPRLVHDHRAQFAGGHMRCCRDAIERTRQRLSDLQQFGHLHAALSERL